MLALSIKVILSLPISRFDNNVTSCQRVQELIKKLVGLNLPCINNCNLTRKHIGKKGLHLNNYGTARYAMKLISLMKRFYYYKSKMCPRGHKRKQYI